MKRTILLLFLLIFLRPDLFSQEIEGGSYIGAGLDFGVTLYNAGNTNNPFSAAFEYSIFTNYDLLRDRGTGFSARLGFASSSNKYHLKIPYSSGSNYDTKDFPVYINQLYLNAIVNRSYLEQGFFFGVGFYGAFMVGDGINTFRSYQGKYDNYDMTRTSDKFDYGVVILFNKSLVAFSRNFMSLEMKAEYRLAPYDTEFYDVSVNPPKLLGEASIKSRISFSAGFSVSFAASKER